MAKKTRRIKKRACDFTLLLTTLLLVFIGIIMVFSSSWPEAIRVGNSGYYFLKKQLLAGVLGLFALVFFMNYNYKKLDNLAGIIFIVSLATGVLIFTPLGKEVGGARRWVDLKFITFMPSDIIKLGSIIFLASFLSKRRRNPKSIREGVVPVLIIIGISCGMIYAQKDLSTTITLALSLMCIFFVAGIRLHHLTALGLSAVGVLVLMIRSEGNEYRLRRYSSFKDPFADKLDTGFQVVQSLYALGSGGLFGSGLGKSRQKFFYIPEAHNDFIFAIIGEELGFIGSLIVIILFLLLIWRGIRISLNIDDEFGCLLATGIVSLIAIQSLIHIGVVTSSIPPTGIPLPFVSYGGTSLILNMASIGILLNISRHINIDRS